MSGDDGLREALERTRVELAVALDEIAALRAKADTADRVRELFRTWAEIAQPQTAVTKLYAIRSALDGPLC